MISYSEGRRMNTRKVAGTGLLLAVALVLSFIESRIPVFIAVPGVKAGLANIAVVFALYRLGWREALVISVFKVLLSALFFGSFVSLAYSAAGAVLAFAVMALVKKTKLFGVTAVSVSGAVAHNLGQIGMACLIMENTALAYYLPVLIISGVAAGIVIGLVSALLVRRIDPEDHGSD